MPAALQYLEIMMEQTIELRRIMPCMMMLWTWNKATSLYSQILARQETAEISSYEEESQIPLVDGNSPQ